MDIQYLLWLQDLRGGFLDACLMAVTDFVASPVVYIFAAVLYWCFNKRAAIYLAMNLSVGSFINQTLKNTFCIYRPWIKHPEIVPYRAAMESATGYSFPSGHTQIAAAEFLSIAHWQKKRKWIVFLCLFMTLLVMFTRNYLGVHTPQDVLVSLAVSLLVMCCNIKLLNWIEKGKQREVLVFVVGILVALLGLLYTTLKPYPTDYTSDGSLLVNPETMITDCYLAAGCLVGFLSGFLLERRFVGFSTNVSGKKRLVRALTGAVVLLFYVAFAREPLTHMHMYWGEFIFIAIAFLYILFFHPTFFCWLEKRFGQ